MVRINPDGQTHTHTNTSVVVVANMSRLIKKSRAVSKSTRYLQFSKQGIGMQIF